MTQPPKYEHVERQHERKPYCAKDTRRSGAVSWFNTQQRAKTAGLPSAMEIAMTKAVRHG